MTYTVPGKVASLKVLSGAVFFLTVVYFVGHGRRFDLIDIIMGLSFAISYGCFSFLTAMDEIHLEFALTGREVPAWYEMMWPPRQAAASEKVGSP